MRIGIVGRSVQHAATWSGIPAGLTRGLHEIGCDTSLLDARVPRLVQRALAPRALANGRPTRAFEPRVMAAARVAASLRRLRSRERVDGWIQLDSDIGRCVRGPFVTFEDMTLAEAVRHPSLVHARLPDDSVTKWRQRQAAVYAGATACCVASEWARTSVVDDYGVDPAKVHVVGFGRNLDLKPVERDWHVPRFLFVGLDWERKNGDAVVDAFRELRGALPTARLDVVGRHPRIDDAGVTGHGPLDIADAGQRRRLEDLFLGATCFVMPSLVEPFGIVYAEAAAAGIPSIGSAVGGAAQVIGDAGGILVAPHDHAALVTAMRDLAEPEVARAAGAAAAARAHLFTWRMVAERLVRALGMSRAGLTPYLG